MLRIPRDHFTYEFSATTEPVATVCPGRSVRRRNHDTSTGRIHRIEDVPEFVRVQGPAEGESRCWTCVCRGSAPGRRSHRRDSGYSPAAIRFRPRAGRSRSSARRRSNQTGVLMARIDGEQLVLASEHPDAIPSHGRCDRDHASRRV